MSIETINVGFSDFPLLLDIPYPDDGARVHEGISENIRNGCLFGVPQNHPYPGYPKDLIGIHLGVATRDNNQGGWVEAMGPPHQLSGLVVRSVSDSARVDDIDIGSLGEGDDFKSVPLKECSHQRGVKLVCLAS
jgi:hypothetical protein